MAVSTVQFTMVLVSIRSVAFADFLVTLVDLFVVAIISF